MPDGAAFPTRCTCGSDQIMAIKPGLDGETLVLLGTLLVVRREVPDVAWCRACWIVEFGQKPVEAG